MKVQELNTSWKSSILLFQPGFRAQNLFLIWTNMLHTNTPSMDKLFLENELHVEEVVDDDAEDEVGV